MFRPAGELVPVERRHIDDMLSNARAEDRIEFECVEGRPLEQELQFSLDSSSAAHALVIGGELVSIFGEVDMGEGVGVPWMISTTALDRHRRAFLTRCDRQIASMRERYKLLINYTDARYTKALAWMQWMGFHMHPAIPYGVNQEPFHPFTLRGI